MAPRFESMSVDELIDFKLARKHKIQDLQAEIDEAQVVYNRKVNQERLQDKIKAAGLEGVVVVPEAAILAAEGK